MPTQIKSLKTYPTIAEALRAIDSFYDAFLKAHKRKTKVELMVSIMSSPFDRSKQRLRSVPESAEVRVHFALEDEAEAMWFIDYANQVK